MSRSIEGCLDQEPLEEIIELVEHVADRMAAGVHKHALYRELKKDFGHFAFGVYEKLRRHAEALNRERIESKTTELGSAISWYKNVIANDSNSLKYKLRAREQLSKILGLEHIPGSVQEKAEAIRKMREMMGEI